MIFFKTNTNVPGVRAKGVQQYIAYSDVNGLSANLCLSLTGL